MIAPQLTASELVAVVAARTMTPHAYPDGSMVAKCGHTVLFAAGGAESFAALWKQAERVRAEVAK